MTQVRWAAEALLESHSAGWRWWWRWERLRKSAAVHRLSTIHEVIETGMVTIYARHFTGDRQLPEKWWPEGRRQPTHKLLVDRRMNVAAHADDTAERGLINPNALHGMPGSFVMEFRRPLMADELREVEHHAACMTARYSDGVLALKRELGIAAYGDPIGEGAYDE